MDLVMGFIIFWLTCGALSLVGCRKANALTHKSNGRTIDRETFFIFMAYGPVSLGITMAILAMKGNHDE